MLIAEMLLVLLLFDVAAWIELAVDRTGEEWTPLYWVQLAAAIGSVAFGLFVLWANRELVGEMVLFLPHVIVFLVVLLPVSMLMVAYATTFALGYWSYRPPEARHLSRTVSP